MTYHSLVVLTGAGISAESGLRTFRDANGLWEDHPIEDVATPEGFARDPALVHRFYNQRRAQLTDPAILPNAAHRALAQLESTFPGAYLLVTQNVDNLHERAGSHRVVHMHGELVNVRCLQTGYVYPVTGPITPKDRCVCCGLPGQLRPDIVWFGEMPMQMNRIYQALSHCDLFIAIGTSGHVYPAAGFVEVANASGAHSVEINLEPSRQESHFHEHRYGLASEAVPAYLKTL